MHRPRDIYFGSVLNIFGLTHQPKTSAAAVDAAVAAVDAAVAGAVAVGHVLRLLLPALRAVRL